MTASRRLSAFFSFWSTSSTTAVCLGIDVQVQIVLPILIGILFIYIGNMLPKFKHNYFVGIKRHGLWQILKFVSDPSFQRKSMVPGGFFIILSAFLPSPLNLGVLLAAILILCFVRLFIPIIFTAEVKIHKNFTCFLSAGKYSVIYFRQEETTQ